MHPSITSCFQFGIEKSEAVITCKYLSHILLEASETTYHHTHCNSSLMFFQCCYSSVWKFCSNYLFQCLRDQRLWAIISVLSLCTKHYISKYKQRNILRTATVLDRHLSYVATTVDSCFIVFKSKIYLVSTRKYLVIFGLMAKQFLDGQASVHGFFFTKHKWKPFHNKWCPHRAKILQINWYSCTAFRFCLEISSNIDEKLCVENIANMLSVIQVIVNTDRLVLITGVNNLTVNCGLKS